jgi:hypothetical protein
MKKLDAILADLPDLAIAVSGGVEERGAKRAADEP